MDRIRYLRMRHKEQNTVRGLCNIPIEQRSLHQEFLLRMFLKCDINYFSEYDRHTLDNLTKILRQVEFHKNDIIYRKGDEADLFYILVKGSVGLYDSLNSKVDSIRYDN